MKSFLNNLFFEIFGNFRHSTIDNFGIFCTSLLVCGGRGFCVGACADYVSHGLLAGNLEGDVHVVVVG